MSSCMVRTLKPPDLSGWSVSLVVPGRDPEDDGGLGGGVHVRRAQRSLTHHTRVRLAAVHAHERQLRLRGLLCSNTIVIETSPASFIRVTVIRK